MYEENKIQFNNSPHIKHVFVLIKPGPEDHATHCHHLVSVVVDLRHTSTKSSLKKTFRQLVIN